MSEDRNTCLAGRQDSLGIHPVLADRGSSLLYDPLEQSRDRPVKGSGNRLEHPKADFLPSLLQVRNIVFVHPRLFGKVNLSPAPLNAQLPNPFPQCNADVLCYLDYRGIAQTSDSTIVWSKVDSYCDCSALNHKPSQPQRASQRHRSEQSKGRHEETSCCIRICIIGCISCCRSGSIAGVSYS